MKEPRRFAQSATKQALCLLGDDLFEFPPPSPLSLKDIITIVTGYEESVRRESIIHIIITFESNRIWGNEDG